VVAELKPDRVETLLPATPASPGVARRFVGSALRRWSGDESAVEAAQLLVSEVVTNAVVHADSEVRLVVIARDQRFRVEVTDRNTDPARLRLAGPDATGGRGLAIVEQIAWSWGSDRRSDGKVVWFEIAR
jgi:anti-sigma regulatory factor (Ser/Thr protein kinase)